MNWAVVDVLMVMMPVVEASQTERCLLDGWTTVTDESLGGRKRGERSLLYYSGWTDEMGLG